MHLQTAFYAEERLVSVGCSNGGGPRSLQECFAQSVSGLREWIVMGEFAFDRLLGICTREGGIWDSAMN